MVFLKKSHFYWKNDQIESIGQRRNRLSFTNIDWTKYTEKADRLLKQLFPICRSITGQGVRDTFAILNGETAFEVKEVPSGTQCFDWTVPDEWNIKDAFVADESGNRIIDFQKNNIHLVNYSEPIDRTVDFEELSKHLFYLRDLPDAIPYRTSYYNKTWGFCTTYNEFVKIDKTKKYRVFIDSTLAPGKLNFGEKILIGESGKEYLVSTYVCHPSLGNDNLSGVVLWSLLLSILSQQKLHHSYRFVIIPETIGSILYLSQNKDLGKKVSGGFITSTVAGPGQFGYKKTFLSNHEIDRVVRKTYKELKIDFLEYPFDVNGSDERQYSSPAFRIPIGTITKDKYYEYPFYHTSLDNLDFISAENLIATLKLYLLAIEKLEQNLTYRSKMPYGEPMLGKRGLYPKIGGSINQKAVDFSTPHGARSYAIDMEKILYGNELDALRWLLFYCDGQTSLLEIAEKTDLPMRQLAELADRLVKEDLLEIA